MLYITTFVMYTQSVEAHDTNIIY